ncbi:hypothetical protein [Actinoplanes sp. NPDC049265]|uniref:hypothetical protein n=1 Tax=Actinoplanes sp. NPDC049265 TaxID=3363902 RepID=UPI003713A54A
MVWDDGRTRVMVSFTRDSGNAIVELEDLDVGGGVVLDVVCGHDFAPVLEALADIGRPTPATFRVLTKALLARFPVYDNDGEQSRPVSAAFLAGLPD